MKLCILHSSGMHYDCFLFFLFCFCWNLQSWRPFMTLVLSLYNVVSWSSITACPVLHLQQCALPTYNANVHTVVAYGLYLCIHLSFYASICPSTFCTCFIHTCIAGFCGSLSQRQPIAGLAQKTDTIHTHTQTYSQFRLINLPNKHVFGLETGASGERLCMHREDMQTQKGPELRFKPLFSNYLFSIYEVYFNFLDW